MQKINQPKVISKKIRRLSLDRLQNGFTSFAEKPSDKFDQLKGDVTSDKINKRINAVELFSLFTADIIKKKVLFYKVVYQF